MSLRKQGMRLGIVGAIAALAFAAAPNVLAHGHSSFGISIAGPGFGIGYASGGHGGYYGGAYVGGYGNYYGGGYGGGYYGLGYGAYYAPAPVYYAPAPVYYGGYYNSYPAYGVVYRNGPVVRRPIARQGVRYYDNRGSNSRGDYGRRAEYYNRGP